MKWPVTVVICKFGDVWSIVRWFVDNGWDFLESMMECIDTCLNDCNDIWHMILTCTRDNTFMGMQSWLVITIFSNVWYMIQSFDDSDRANLSFSFPIFFIWLWLGCRCSSSSVQSVLPRFPGRRTNVTRRPLEDGWRDVGRERVNYRLWITSLTSIMDP